MMRTFGWMTAPLSGGEQIGPVGKHRIHAGRKQRFGLLPVIHGPDRHLQSMTSAFTQRFELVVLGRGMKTDAAQRLHLGLPIGWNVDNLQRARQMRGDVAHRSSAA